VKSLRHSRVFWILAGVTVLGGALRLAPGVTSGFPVGDGGLFAVMAQDLRAAGFAPPLTTSYNGGGIPFAYPPLGLYLLAAVPGSCHDTLRWLPGLLATAAIPSIYLVALPRVGVMAAVASAAAFAVMPQAVVVLIEGGGVTRSLGLVLALLAVAAADRHRWLPAGGLFAAAALSHPAAGAFAFLGVVLARTPLRSTLVAIGTGVVLVLPWFALVVARHGVDVFLNAATSQDPAPLRGVADVLAYPLPNVVGFLAVPGLVLNPRLGAWFVASAVLVATAPYVCLPALLALGVGAVLRRYPALRIPTVLGLGVSIVLAAATLSRLGPIDGPTRAVMERADADLTGGTPVAVRSGRFWFNDWAAEWLPALTSLRGATTLQGREWLPGWDESVRRVEALQRCPSTRCVEAWMREARVDYLIDTTGQPLDLEVIHADGDVTLYRIDVAAQPDVSGITRIGPKTAAGVTAGATSGGLRLALPG
jgi:hypothetical protein